MNVSTIAEILEKKKYLTIHLCGHADPIKIEGDKHKPILDRKKKTLTLSTPGYISDSTRCIVIDVNSITYVEYNKFLSEYSNEYI